MAVHPCSGDRGEYQGRHGKGEAHGGERDGADRACRSWRTCLGWDERRVQFEVLTALDDGLPRRVGPEEFHNSALDTSYAMLVPNFNGDLLEVTPGTVVPLVGQWDGVPFGTDQRPRQVLATRVCSPEAEVRTPRVYEAAGDSR